MHSSNGLIIPAPVTDSITELYAKDSDTTAITTQPILPTITHPAQVANLSLVELEQLATEIRKELVSTVSKNGGHLAPSLGVVELTLAMLSVFNPAEDKLIWDVGHQAYAYKILTGRRHSFHTLRQFGGISGFPSREESEFDHFGVGHSSTSISAALGMAVARDRAEKEHHVVSIIGDGALTSGLAYEGLNQAGAIAKKFIVILNDNEMSISKNVGALSLFMSKNLSSPLVLKIKREIETLLAGIPAIGEDLVEIARRSKHSFKNFFTPGILFEALRFNYIGAVDGHNIEELQKVLRLAASLDHPVLVHVLTRKGKGYAPAENNPTRFHGVSEFEPQTGAIISKPNQPPSYTKIFGDTLCSLAEKDERIVAITAAMPDGTGLLEFAERFPTRFFDVGICEPHAVTFAAGLATEGLRPFVCVYSTFMQRAYDQIIHDVCLQKLPVTFCLDRAGLVGEDGATHHGAFDLSYLRHIPNLTLFVPRDGAQLQQGLVTALAHNAPFALRYPRGHAPDVALLPLPLQTTPIPLGQGEFLCKGAGRLGVIAIGSTVLTALKAAKLLEAEGVEPITIFDARWVKPLPESEIKDIVKSHDKLMLVEENTLCGGFSSAVLELLSDSSCLDKVQIMRVGLPDTFVTHGSTSILQEQANLDITGLAHKMRIMLYSKC